MSETAIETPIETAIETAIETPVETPVETAIETPVETQVERRIELVIDYREHHLISEFATNNFTEFTTQNLILGDIVFLENNKPLLIIERKTLSDMSASIKDSRWKEQKSRLKDSNTNVMYLLENCKTKSRLLSDKIINSALFNTLFRDNFKIYQSKNLADTCQIIILLLKKFRDNEFVITSQSSVSQIKRSTKILDNIFIHQLNVIPGVSLNIAKIISENYKSWTDLIEVFKNNGDTALANLMTTPNRKLGVKMSAKIFNSIFT
jgi:crossover junction endonuclease MUS81